MDAKPKIGIIGLGLIGGSIAIALNKKYTVVGCSKNAETVSYALKNKIIHIAADDYYGFADCTAVFVCTPIGIVKQTVEAVYNALGDSVIITDVGSVKGMLAGMKGRVVGGHPMAGTEQHGITAAKDRLLENAYYILCGYGGNDKDLETVKALVKDMCALPVVMTADAHDRLVAKISHLPHMLAYSLVSSALSENIDIVGSGFMDTTRIASSSPDFWAEVARLNKENILSEMDRYIEVFSALRSGIASGSDITPFLAEAKEKRDRLTYAKRYMSEYVLYVDVADRAGSIAEIVTRLAGVGISIDNLQVVGSREGAGGALRIEFKDETSYMQAKEILK